MKKFILAPGFKLRSCTILFAIDLVCIVLWLASYSICSLRMFLFNHSVDSFCSVLFIACNFVHWKLLNLMARDINSIILVFWYCQWCDYGVECIRNIKWIIEFYAFNILYNIFNYGFPHFHFKFFFPFFLHNKFLTLHRIHKIWTVAAEQIKNPVPSK